jgi:thiol-disulfide isomerase/thioredoxin
VKEGDGNICLERNLFVAPPAARPIENPATAARFNARSIPTLLLLKAGREVDRIVGAQPKSEIARRLERVMA